MKTELLHQAKNLTLRFKRTFAHPPETLWRALTEQSDLDHWFPARIDGPRETGATISFVFMHNEGPTMTGVIQHFEPPKLLVFDWGGSPMRWEIVENILHFDHTFDDPTKPALFAAGWHLCLDNLEAHLDGRQPAKDQKAQWNAYHEIYLQQFPLEKP